MDARRLGYKRVSSLDQHPERQLIGTAVDQVFTDFASAKDAHRPELLRLLLSIMGAFAEFERALIRERQREGVAMAKARGTYKGGTPKLSPGLVDELRQLAASGVPRAQLARRYRLSRQTVYRYLT